MHQVRSPQQNVNAKRRPLPNTTSGSSWSSCGVIIPCDRRYPPFNLRSSHTTCTIGRDPSMNIPLRDATNHLIGKSCPRSSFIHFLFYFLPLHTFWIFTGLDTWYLLLIFLPFTKRSPTLRSTFTRIRRYHDRSRLQHGKHQWHICTS